MRFEKRVLILTPTALPSITGNAINTERWKRLISKAGAHVELVAIQSLDIFPIKEKIENFKPHVIHAHHALKTGSLFLQEDMAKARANTPLVLSLPGTDINIDLKSNRDIIMDVLNTASALICQSKTMEEKVRKEFPLLKKPIYYVPRSIVWLGHEPFKIRDVAGCKDGDILFFHPAGIREVKGNLQCLEYFKELNRMRKHARILFSGPILEEEYGRLFKERLKECHEFARWIPFIPPEAIKSAYEGADIVLNTSLSEGISTVLLEAINLAKPSLASDIPPNRWLIMDCHRIGRCGLMYDLTSKQDFIEKAVKMIDDKGLMESLSANAKEFAKYLPKPNDELRGLIRVYIHVL
ncbi:MAG TPA: glycosyltransferase family 4 protein [Syntrophorhabdaceae bacterium]|nr:glycosyltransferase family 4 protein [Syntrophorhabdaceae bacterium]